MHQDRHAPPDGRGDQVDGPRHVGPRAGVGQALQVGPEERLGVLGRAQAALDEDGGERFGDVEV
ncbi:MAG: hypothetical protein DMD34_08950 [Gemmatimonadetes bacterium]|nr:MAG: hypothetical protein DMD34_08950 [Gemmatimonadota bacterium]